MALLICSSTKEELAALAPDKFPKPELIPEMQPILASLKRVQAIFLLTGPGPLNAALAAGYSLGLAGGADMPKIEAVLCAGLAGAFDLRSAPLLSVWRVSEEIWPEYGLNDGVAVAAHAFRFPQWAGREGGDIYDRLALAEITAIAPNAKKEADWPDCASLTVAGVTASFARRDALISRYGAKLENMEGFALAYAAARAFIPCLEIRVVSQKAGPRSRDEKDHEGALRVLNDILPALNLN